MLNSKYTILNLQLHSDCCYSGPDYPLQALGIEALVITLVYRCWSQC